MKKMTENAEDFEPPSPSENPDPSACVSYPKVNPKVSPLISVSGAPKIRCSPNSIYFRKKIFPHVSHSEWNDWRWQLRNRITDIQMLRRVVTLSADEETALSSGPFQLPMAITPYYASLMSPDDPGQAIRRAVIPVLAERFFSTGEADDPLGEDHDSPVTGLIHRYPDRVLFLVTDFCSTYCRYCTRSRMVGNGRKIGFDLARWEKAIAYIAATPSVRDVLLSGGDPLTLSDENLEWLLSRITKIPHVELVRIGTKAPVVLPQRITPSLTRMLKKYHPLWMSVHFMHPDELTPETTQACERLANAGIPLGSQTVLLAGINDNLETIRRLMHGLVKTRVKPYYLYQCDPIVGSAHVRTPVEKGLEIIRGLRGFTTGYAVPTYVIDAPGGGGKIPLLPDYVEGRDQDDLLLKNYQGRTYRYPDPGGRVGCSPSGGVF
jgi:lysine 2,3-aminomutase